MYLNFFSFNVQQTKRKWQKLTYEQLGPAMLNECLFDRSLVSLHFIKCLWENCENLTN
jgi:hypothetical protein